ncbi:hypothetical protein [Halosimplex salinum]|uniref:hypothetical protein n=1 Tax=Halosimplex salinum TaxID=1710538 RepID=UPI000F468091|nr:hypothetical protein [Halosimplex salinum]
MKWQALQSFLSQQGVLFIHDTTEQRPQFGLLRCLPALHRLGIAEFTYPWQWRKLRNGNGQGLFPYQYTLLPNIEYDDQMLAALTTQYYEDKTQHSISSLINQWRHSGTMVVVANERRFQTQQGLRPLYHEPFAIARRPYTDVYDAVQQWYNDQGFVFRLTDTQNVFLQDNAILYELVSGETVTQTTDLFDVVNDAPYLPLYDVIAAAFQSEDGLGTSPKKDVTLQAFADWFRRRIEWEPSEAEAVVRSLNAMVSENMRAFDPAAVAQDAAMIDARRQANDLESTPIGQTYKAWLQRDP